jgi:hypothetical protein
MKNKDGKEIKVEFAPGCFDDFDGTQEELDALQKEIMHMFTSMTPEELEDNSRPLIDAIDDEEDAEFLKSVIEKISNSEKRNLQ